MDADEALAQLGKYSKWQIKSFVIFAFGYGVPFAWFSMAIVFIGDMPNYRCNTLPNNTINESIPQICGDEGQCTLDKCHLYSNITYRNNKTNGCLYGYWNDLESGYESTLVTDFNLYCGNEWLVELSITVMAVGLLVGSIIFPVISDIYGRKKVFLGCLWTGSLLFCIQSFSLNMTMYTILSFLQGLMLMGQVIAAVILALELFPAEQRTFAGASIEFFWALGYITVCPFAYFIRNWRYLQLAMSVPMFATIGFYWYIEESIPWLVTMKRRQDAEDILQNAAKFSKVTIKQNILTSDDQTIQTSIQEKIIYKNNINGNNNEENFKLELNSSKNNNFKCDREAKYSIMQSVWNIMKSKKLTLYSCIQFIIWTINSIGYCAISMTVTYLPGNRYVNFLLYAVMEIPAYILMWILLTYSGRRLTICLSHLIGGLALLGILLADVVFTNSNYHTPVVITLSTLGKTCFTVSFGAIYVQSPELFPTAVRNTGFGLCQLFGKVGVLTAPYFRLIARNQPLLSPVITGTSSILAGLCALILPETRNEPLPETAADVKKFKRSRNKRY